MTRADLLAAATLLAACSHETATATVSSTDAGVTTSATAVAASSSGPASSAAPTASGAASAATGKARTVNGPYQATKGTFYIPDSSGWSGVKQLGEDDPSGIGAGTVSLEIGADGRVRGKITGALGELTVDGLDRDGELTAQLTPAAGAPINSFTGTLIAKDDGAKVTGTMRLSDGINRLVRVADVKLGG
jgi:hypothetical protein